MLSGCDTTTPYALRRRCCARFVLQARVGPRRPLSKPTRRQTALHERQHTRWRSQGPHRLVVRTSRRGRDNPGSAPGVDIFARPRRGRHTSRARAAAQACSWDRAADAAACHSGVAQWLACWAHNPKVRGSKPRSATFPRRVGFAEAPSVGAGACCRDTLPAWSKGVTSVSCVGSNPAGVICALRWFAASACGAAKSAPQGVATKAGVTRAACTHRHGQVPPATGHMG